MNGFINLSEALLIAIHSMIIIAQGKKELTSSKQIAHITGASYNTISKVMQTLVKARLISSTRGPSGGFYLNKPPSLVSFYDIYKVIEGEPRETACLFNSHQCPAGKCIFGDTMKKISRDFKQFLIDRKLSLYSE